MTDTNDANDANDPLEEFRADLAQMKVKEPSTVASNRDPLMARIGAVTMSVGVLLAVVSYFLSHGTKDVLEQNDYQILAVIGLTLGVVGSAVYVRASMAQFLRFWLARMIHEQRTDRDG